MKCLINNIFPILFLGFLTLSCIEEVVDPQPHRNTAISLEAVHTGITSVKLNITVDDTTDNWIFTLTRNDSAVFTATVEDTDTTITDNHLIPTTEYRYRAYWMDEETRIDSSNRVTVVTGDTTSHHFVWEIDTLGEYGSYLNDVAIVDENNIWVVGNIETDSSEYNAAHWNGIKWELVGIYSNTLNLHSIKYFAEDDIWVTSYCLPYHWDGEIWSQYHLQNMGLNVCVGSGIWGTSSSNIYFVGNNGSIVHYDGQEFEQMERGTDVDLIGIDGTPDGDYVFTVGYDFMGENSGKSIALEMTDGNWCTLYNGTNYFSEPYGLITSVTVIDETTFIGCSEGVWQYNYLYKTENLLTHDDLMWNNSIKKIRANTLNDIIIVSNWGMINHYNGYDWQTSSSLSSIVLNDGSFYARGLDITANKVIIAGLASSEMKAIVITGIKQ